MNVVIDPAAQTVTVDGETIAVPIDIAPEIRRITWEDKAGTIDYRAPQPFSDFAIVAPHVDAWEAERDRLALEAEASAMVGEVTAALNAFPPAQKIELARQAIQELRKITGQ